jgi:hypothetical protein
LEYPILAPHLIQIIIMKYVLPFIFSFLAVSASFGQESPIEIRKNRLFQDYQYLDLSSLQQKFETSPEALALVNQAKSQYGTANVLGFVGGFLIGWPIGTAIGGGEPAWALAGAGAGILAVAIPINSSANKKVKQAVDIYNGGLNSTGTAYLKLSGGNGLGLTLVF